MEGSYWRTRSKLLANNNSFTPLNLVPCRPMAAFNAAVDSAWLMEPFLGLASVTAWWFEPAPTGNGRKD